MIISFHTAAGILVRTSDGHQFELAQPIVFAREDGAVFQVPVGATTDGASTPPEIWNLIPPFGNHWRGCVIHDSAYRGSLLRQLTDGTWAPAMLSKDECDTLLLDVMTSDHVEQAKRDAIYEGVHLGGWKAFRDDRAVTPGVTPEVGL